MNTATNKLQVTMPSDTEVVMTRVFDAPRHLVFEAFSKCEHIKRWWGGGSLADCQIDFRPGGAWRYMMKMPNDMEMVFKGVYKEIVAQEKISNTFTMEPQAFGIRESLQTNVFTEENGKTTITATHVYESKEVRDAVASSGMEKGAGYSYDCLEEFLKGQASNSR